MEMREIKLGDVVTVKGGKRLPKGINLITTPNAHPYIRVRDLNGKRTLELDSSFEFVDDETQKSISRYIVNDGDIVLSIVGTIGLVAIVGSSLNKANLTENCVKLTSLSGIDRDFLYYFLKSSYGQQEIARGTVGAVQAKLPIKNIQDITITLPDELTQRRIAAILSSLDTKIETNQKINDNLQRLFTLQYNNTFVEKRNPSWESVPLSDVFFFQEGPGIRNWQYVTQNGTKFINIRCISDGDINTTTANMISNEEASGKYAHFMLEPYDIVMSCSGTLGRYAIIRPHHLPLCLNTSVIRFRPHRSFEDFSFLYGYLTSNEFLNKQREMACGSVQANFGPTHLKKIEVVLAPIEVRNAFHNLTFPLISQMIQLRDENNKLSDLRDTLLSKLMSGEIDVSAINI